MRGDHDRFLSQLGSDTPLQVAKLVNSSDIGADGRKKVFDAVGFSFINRLLATSMLVTLDTLASSPGPLGMRLLMLLMPGSEEASNIHEYTFIVPHFADKPPEGCSENPYHKIAITILACFCTDPELVSRSLVDFSCENSTPQ